MNTNPLTTLQEQVLDLIKARTKQSPITGSEISTKLNLTDKDHKTGANLRSVVNTLRDKGFPICANSQGYFMPETPEELDEYIEQFQDRINQQQQACDALKARRDNWKAVKKQAMLFKPKYYL